MFAAIANWSADILLYCPGRWKVPRCSSNRNTVDRVRNNSSKGNAGTARALNFSTTTLRSCLSRCEEEKYLCGILQKYPCILLRVPWEMSLSVRAVGIFLTTLRYVRAYGCDESWEICEYFEQSSDLYLGTSEGSHARPIPNVSAIEQHKPANHTNTPRVSK